MLLSGAGREGMVSTRCPPGRNGLPPWTSSGGLTAKGQAGVSQDRPPPKPKKVNKNYPHQSMNTKLIKIPLSYQAREEARGVR